MEEAPSDHIILKVTRVLGAYVWVMGVFTLPPGDKMWPAAILAVVMPVVLGRLLGKGLPKPRLGEPAGLWWGLAIFSLVIPRLDFPYRPATLLAVMGTLVALGLAELARRLVKRGWPAGKAIAVSAVTLILTAIATAIGTAI